MPAAGGHTAGEVAVGWPRLSKHAWVPRKLSAAPSLLACSVLGPATATRVEYTIGVMPLLACISLSREKWSSVCSYKLLRSALQLVRVMPYRGRGLCGFASVIIISSDYRKKV